MRLVYSVPSFPSKSTRSLFYKTGFGEKSNQGGRCSTRVALVSLVALTYAKFTWSGGLHPRMLRNLLHIRIATQSSSEGHSDQRFLNDWRTVNASRVFKKCKKHYPRSYRLVSFTSIHGKTMNKVHLEVSCCWCCCWLEIAIMSTKGKSSDQPSHPCGEMTGAVRLG